MRLRLVLLGLPLLTLSPLLALAEDFQECPSCPQMVAIPALVVFYNLPLGRVAAPLIAIAVLAAIGLVAIGTLFSAMAVNTRLAELLLPMLSLPFFVPIVIAASQSTAKLLSGRPVAEVGAWLKLLAAFDIVFVAACTLAYPLTVDD